MRSKLSEFIPIVALAAAIMLAAAACGGNDDENTVTETGTATAAPAAQSGAPARQLDTPAPPATDSGVPARQLDTPSPPATGSGVPAFPLNTPDPPADETVPGEIETAARKLLADELEVDEGELRLDSSEGVGWPDASLGCPKEGYAYAQVITPGHKLVFDFEGTSHAVHTNFDGSHMVLCEDQQ